MQIEQLQDSHQNEAAQYTKAIEELEQQVGELNSKTEKLELEKNEEIRILNQTTLELQNEKTILDSEA